MKKIHSAQAPEAVGPYSQAIESDGLLYCSGQIPLDPKTGKLIDGSIEDQTRQVMKNLSAVLKQGGSSFGGVIKATIYLKDLNDFIRVNEVYASYFSEPFPARVTIQAGKLPLDAQVEIDAIAKVL